MKVVMLGLALFLALGCGGKAELPTYIEPNEKLNDVDAARLLKELQSLESITGVDGQKQDRIIWVFKTETLASSSSPAIGADGTIYIGEKGGGFYALNGTT